MNKLRGPLSAFVVLAMAAGVGAVVAPPVAAQGQVGTFGTLVMPDAVANGSTCVTVTISFTSNGQLEDWQAQLSSGAPNSTEGPHVSLTEAAPSQNLTFCTDRHVLGTYEFTGWVSGRLIGQNNYTSEPLKGTVKFSVAQRASSSIAVAVTRSRAKRSCPLGRTAHCSRVAGKVVSAGKPKPWNFVDLQVYRHHRWVRTSSARTDGLGRVVWFVTIGSQQRYSKFRLRFAGDELARGSVSRSFRMKY